MRAARILLIALAAAAPAFPAGAAVDPLGPADQGEALHFEELIGLNIWHDQVFEIDFNPTVPIAERTRDDIISVNHFGDSALWTGTYLAAESFRYATAKAKLAEGEGPPGFWQVQRDHALARIETFVKKFHLLINISKNWRYDFQPALDPPRFGGGVIPSEPGLLFRACIPTDAPAFSTWTTRGARVYGPIPWDDGKEYWCEDGTSRDAYAGTTFGLLTAFDLVSPDVPWMRAMIRNDVMAMTAYTLKYAWNTPRPHGNISLPVQQLEPYTPFDIWGHDFENFVSPLFVYVPLARLNMTQAARHVAREAGTLTESAHWEGVWAEELATQGPVLGFSMEVDSFQPNDGYYKYNLHHLTGYNVVRLERDPAVRALFKQALSIMDKTTGDDVNAHFETITYALTGDTQRRDAAITHLRQWLDYRERIDQGVPTENPCGPIECVRQDQLEVVFDGADPVVIFPGTSGNMRARRPLPVASRPPTDFLWQRPPTQRNGFEGANHQAPGIDYLLPYWMLRYYTEVAEPAAEPFPPYPGPAHA